jgi:hypothetical protein
LAGGSTNTIVLLAALLVRGAGLGAAMVPLMGAAFIGLPRADVPSASIITRVVQQIGGSMGTAILAVVLERATAGGATGGFRDAFWWAVAFTAVAVPLSLLLPGRSVRAPRQTGGAEAVPAPGG